MSLPTTDTDCKERKEIENFVDYIFRSPTLTDDEKEILLHPKKNNGCNRLLEHSCFKCDRRICGICDVHQEMYCPYCKVTTIHNCGKSQVLCCEHCNRPPVSCYLCDNPPVKCIICCSPLPKKKRKKPNPVCKSCRRKHYLFVVASLSNRNGDLLNYPSEYFILRNQILEELGNVFPTVLAGIVMDF